VTVVSLSRPVAPVQHGFDESDWIGLGVSVLLHGGLALAALIGLLEVTKDVPPPPPAVEVEIVSEQVGLTSAVPEPAPSPPAPRVAPEQGPPEEAAPPEPLPAPPDPLPAPPKAVSRPAPARAVPVPRPTPSPKPSPVAAPQRPAVSRPAPAAPTDARARRRPGLDRSLVAGLRDAPGAPTRTPSPATTTAAAAPIGAAQQSALGRVIREQLKPHWRAPTGADAELLRTELRVTLARNGSVTSVSVLRTTGINESNRTQVRLHQEAATKAVRLASPFRGLPDEFYSSWSTLETVGFDRRLSQ